MISGWGNGRFDYAFSVGGRNNYARIMHGFPIATNDKAELVPGIATGWNLSNGGLTWTLILRQGAKFHDGTEVTAGDLLWTWRHQWNPEAVEWTTQAGAQSLGRIMDKIEQTGPDQVSMTTTIPDASLATTQFSEASSAWWVVLPNCSTMNNWCNWPSSW